MVRNPAKGQRTPRSEFAFSGSISERILGGRKTAILWRGALCFLIKYFPRRENNSARWKNSYKI